MHVSNAAAISPTRNNNSKSTITAAATAPDSLIRLTGLSGLRQAVSILHHIDNGQPQNEVVKICDDDQQLVAIWIEFMVELKWLERKGVNARSVSVSAQGKEAIKKYIYS